MNILNENLKIRLKNAINQINHLEGQLENHEGERYIRRTSSDWVIEALEESLNDLDAESEAVLNNFSQADTEPNQADRELITN